jgi:hypothetical protein
MIVSFSLVDGFDHPGYRVSGIGPGRDRYLVEAMRNGYDFQADAPRIFRDATTPFNIRHLQRLSRPAGAMVFIFQKV